MPSSVWMSFVEGTVPGEADHALAVCGAALGAVAEGVVTLRDATPTETGFAVLMEVGAEGSGWQCLVGPDGQPPVLARIE